MPEIRTGYLIWGDARYPYSLYMATLPPNSPSCTNGTGWDEGHSSQISASSNHPGGVNVAMADGSVRFVSETIDCGDPTRFVGPQNEDHQVTGPSGRGVWGAVATPAGGEAKSL